MNKNGNTIIRDMNARLKRKKMKMSKLVNFGKKKHSDKIKSGNNKSREEFNKSIMKTTKRISCKKPKILIYNVKFTC